MKKIFVVVICLCMFLAGCSLSTVNSGVNDSQSSTVEASSNGPDETFVIVDEQVLHPEKAREIYTYIIVEKSTKLMYFYTSQYQSGYGVGLVQMLDADGMPRIYDGELKVANSGAGLDEQTELILSSMDSTEVVLKKEESPFSLRNFFNTMDKYLKMGFVE